MFNIDWYIWLKRYLAPAFRTPIMLAWLYACIKPIIQRFYAPSVLHAVRFPNCLGYAEPSVTAFRRHIILRLSFNCQVICLERLLNLYYYSQFIAANAKATQGYWIYIRDASPLGNSIPLFQFYENLPVPLYQQADYNPAPPIPPNGTAIMAGPQYLYTLEEILAGPDYIIYVPNWLTYSVDEMRKLVDEYNAAGRRYAIVNY